LIYSICKDCSDLKKCARKQPRYTLARLLEVANHKALSTFRISSGWDTVSTSGEIVEVMNRSVSWTFTIGHEMNPCSQSNHLYLLMVTVGHPAETIRFFFFLCDICPQSPCRFRRASFTASGGSADSGRCGRRRWHVFLVLLCVQPSHAHWPHRTLGAVNAHRSPAVRAPARQRSSGDRDPTTTHPLASRGGPPPFRHLMNTAAHKATTCLLMAEMPQAHFRKIRAPPRRPCRPCMPATYTATASARALSTPSG